MKWLIFGLFVTSLPLSFAQSGATAEQLKVVVGFPAGSGLDVITRVVAARVQTTTGTTVIVEIPAPVDAWRRRQSPKPSPTGARSCPRQS
jgi:tripartite-type tricarboxylate transporter receptor subunit TctC